jgi:vacuolar protein sorting-associated protein 72
VVPNSTKTVETEPVAKTPQVEVKSSDLNESKESEHIGETSQPEEKLDLNSGPHLDANATTQKSKDADPSPNVAPLESDEKSDPTTAVETKDAMSGNSQESSNIKEKKQSENATQDKIQEEKTAVNPPEDKKPKRRKPHFKTEVFDVEGPPAKVDKSLVATLHFPEDLDLNSRMVRETLFGPQSNNEPGASRKRRHCPITGLPARFVDPQTNIPYANLVAYRILKLVKAGSLSWNVEFGGAYIGLRESTRHASGVPSGFDE